MNSKKYKPIGNDPKRLAWVLTLLVALITTPCSFYYAYKYVWTWNEAANFQSDSLSHFLLTFFVVFLFMDLICSQLHYKEQMMLFEGWYLKKQKTIFKYTYIHFKLTLCQFPESSLTFL